MDFATSQIGFLQILIVLGAMAVAGVIAIGVVEAI